MTHDELRGASGRSNLVRNERNRIAACFVSNPVGLWDAWRRTDNLVAMNAARHPVTIHTPNETARTCSGVLSTLCAAALLLAAGAVPAQAVDIGFSGVVPASKDTTSCARMQPGGKNAKTVRMSIGSQNRRDQPVLAAISVERANGAAISAYGQQQDVTIAQQGKERFNLEFPPQSLSQSTFKVCISHTSLTREPLSRKCAQFELCNGVAQYAR